MADAAWHNTSLSMQDDSLLPKYFLVCHMLCTGHAHPLWTPLFYYEGSCTEKCIPPPGGCHTLGLQQTLITFLWTVNYLHTFHCSMLLDNLLIHQTFQAPELYYIEDVHCTSYDTPPYLDYIDALCQDILCCKPLIFKILHLSMLPCSKAFITLPCDDYNQHTGSYGPTLASLCKQLNQVLVQKNDLGSQNRGGTHHIQCLELHYKLTLLVVLSLNELEGKNEN